MCMMIDDHCSAFSVDFCLFVNFMLYKSVSMALTLSKVLNDNTSERSERNVYFHGLFLSDRIQTFVIGTYMENIQQTFNAFNNLQVRMSREKDCLLAGTNIVCYFEDSCKLDRSFAW